MKMTPTSKANAERKPKGCAGQGWSLEKAKVVKEKKKKKCGIVTLELCRHTYSLTRVWKMNALWSNVSVLSTFGFEHTLLAPPPPPSSLLPTNPLSILYIVLFVTLNDIEGATIVRP